MKFVDIDLDGMTVRAALNETEAPVTAQAFWEALPFEGRAVHAQISGDMFRMLGPVPVGDLKLESPVYSQHPGQVVFDPPGKEIAFCVGNAEFSAYEGRHALTPLAELEEGAQEWMLRGNQLDVTGARPLKFSRASDQTTPFRFEKGAGEEITIRLGEATVRARLLDSVSSELEEAMKRTFPLEGSGVNSIWAGPQTVLRGNASTSELRQVAMKQQASTFHWKGYLYFEPTEGLFIFNYGQTTANVQGRPQALVPIARCVEELAEYRRVARSQLLEGAKPMAISFAK